MLKIELNSTKQKNSSTIKSTIVPRFNSLNLLRETVDVVCRKQLLFWLNSENIVVKILTPR